MMYRLFTIFILAGCLSSVAGATETVSTDGVWWNDLTPTQKAVVMFGATSAYNQGYFEGDLSRSEASNTEILDTMGALHWSVLQQSKFIGALAKVRDKAKRKIWPDFSGKPIKAYIDGMDYFYSNHPEASRLDFSFVFSCIQNKPTTSCDNVARLAKPRQ